MDSSKKQEKSNPRDKAGFLSILMFWGNEGEQGLYGVGGGRVVGSYFYPGEMEENKDYTEWTFPIFWKGCRKDFGEEDLCGPRVCDLSTKLGDRLEKHWNREMQRAKENHSTPKFLIAILKTFRWEIIIMGLVDCFKDIVPRYNSRRRRTQTSVMMLSLYTLHHLNNSYVSSSRYYIGPHCGALKQRLYVAPKFLPGRRTLPI
uniref:Uncharacterized protein n=1 Tax=Timema genevievae TaxID=629358 RepID=A0A7R9PN47_TIMGE|nr:unnamed protein product [Timema genevievae]